MNLTDFFIYLAFITTLYKHTREMPYISLLLAVNVTFAIQKIGCIFAPGEVLIAVAVLICWYAADIYCKNDLTVHNNNQHNKNAESR